MNGIEVIKAIYPDFSGYVDFTGGVITAWNSPFAQPTPAQIDAAIPLAHARLIEEAIKAEVARRLAPTDFRYIGDYPVSATFTQAAKDALAARRQAVRDFGNAIDPAAIASVDEIAALPWPVV